MGETALLSPLDGSSNNLHHHECHATAAGTIASAFVNSNRSSSRGSTPVPAPVDSLLRHHPHGPKLPISEDFSHSIDHPEMNCCQEISADGDEMHTSADGKELEHQSEPASEVWRPSLWYEEEIDENLRWCFGLRRILHTGVSKFQEIALLDTEPFGKVLTLDRKMQSSEKDEWVYHECLVHPALIFHKSPKKVFIMGGGEGSTAREVLRHRSVRKVVMCDIDEEVVKFCSKHLTMNTEAFQSKRLHLVIDDAKAELEKHSDRFDVIVGDLADPMEGGPCYQLYSKGFYENVLKHKLNHGGIFVTQAGPAGILSHKEVFTSIFNTLRNVFAHVMPYAAHVPSYADMWGWVMASDSPFNELAAEELDLTIQRRIKGDLRYIDGATLHAATVINKTVRQSLLNETHVYTEDTARFVYGHGRNSSYST